MTGWDDTGADRGAQSDSGDIDISLTTPTQPAPVSGPVRLIVLGGVVDEMSRHVRGDTSVEQGGVLVGRFDADRAQVLVEASIPALDAVAREASFKFTHESWDHIGSVMDEQHPGLQLVGWYHSHPHFGIFLSEYDQFIHNNFFNQPWQVAYVIDPLLEQEGWFGWDTSQITRYERWTEVRGAPAGDATRPIGEPTRPLSEPESEPPPGPRAGPPTQRGIPPASLIIVGIIMGLLTGLGIGMVLLSDDDDDPAEALPVDPSGENVPSTSAPGSVTSDQSGGPLAERSDAWENHGGVPYFAGEAILLAPARSDEATVQAALDAAGARVLASDPERDVYQLGFEGPTTFENVQQSLVTSLGSAETTVMRHWSLDPAVTEAALTPDPTTTTTSPLQTTQTTQATQASTSEGVSSTPTTPGTTARPVQVVTREPGPIETIIGVCDGTTGRTCSLVPVGPASSPPGGLVGAASLFNRLRAASDSPTPTIVLVDAGVSVRDRCDTTLPDVQQAHSDVARLIARAILPAPGDSGPTTTTTALVPSTVTTPTAAGSPRWILPAELGVVGDALEAGGLVRTVDFVVTGPRGCLGTP